MKIIVWVKKEIKTEADLPKEGGYYFAGLETKMFDEKGAIGTIEYYPLNDKDVQRVWIQEIAWYLQPIKLDLPDDEEIEKSYKTVCIGLKCEWYKELRDKIKNQLK